MITHAGHGQSGPRRQKGAAMEQQQAQTAPRPPAPQGKTREGYREPLLLKHEPLRNITGQKYGEKQGAEKNACEIL